MKAQADIISLVIIITIAIALVSTAYMWGMPLIRKRQDTTLVERVYKFFDRDNLNSVVRKIEYIAKNGGEDMFTLDVDGAWILYPCPVSDGGGCSCDPSIPACLSENNSIQFSFFSRASNIAFDEGWVSLNTANTNAIGNVGTDDASVVWARSDISSDGFNITYKVWFRELDESPSTGYKINLIAPSPFPPEIKASTSRSIRISYGGTRTYVTPDAKTLIITEIKIFLI